MHPRKWWLLCSASFVKKKWDNYCLSCRIFQREIMINYKLLSLPTAVKKNSWERLADLFQTFLALGTDRGSEESCRCRMTAASLLTALQRERRSSKPMERLQFLTHQIFNLVPYLQKTSFISVIDKPESKSQSKVQAPNPKRQTKKGKGNLESKDCWQTADRLLTDC